MTKGVMNTIYIPTRGTAASVFFFFPTSSLIIFPIGINLFSFAAPRNPSGLWYFNSISITVWTPMSKH